MPLLDQVVDMDNALISVAQMTMRGYQSISDSITRPGAHHSEYTLLLTLCLVVARTLLIEDNLILYKVS
jgi:hypothetical protein